MNEFKNSTEEKCGDVSYLCACNRFETEDKILFINHLKRCSPRERSLFCIRCYKYNVTPEALVKHIEADQCKPESRSFNCGMCAFSTTKGVDLSEHIIQKHKNVMFKPCFYCQKEFSNLHCLMMHLDERTCSPESKLNVSSKESSNTSENLEDTPSKNRGTLQVHKSKQSIKHSNLNARKSSKKTESLPENEKPQKRKAESSAEQTRSRGRPKKYSIIKPVVRESDISGKTESLPNSNEFSKQKLPIKTLKTSANYNQVKFDFKISEIPYKFKSYNALTKFMEEPHICHFFKCMSLKCTYSSDSPQNFALHVKGNHSADKKYCIYCCVDFDCESLADHMVDVHGWRNHQCGECLYRCYNERYLTLHQSAQHNGTSKKLKCPLLKKKVKDEKSEELQPVYCKEYSCTVQKCVFSTKDPVDFVKHLKRSHPSETKLSCALCTESPTLVETAEEYVNHYYNTHNYDVFQCGHCYHGSRTLDGMWMHFSKEHPDVPPRIYKRTTNDNDKYINCAEDQKMFLLSISGLLNEISDKTVYVSHYGMLREKENLQKVYIRMNAHSLTKTPISEFFEKFDCNPMVSLNDMKYV